MTVMGSYRIKNLGESRPFSNVEAATTWLAAKTYGHKAEVVVRAADGKVLLRTQTTKRKSLDVELKEQKLISINNNLNNINMNKNYTHDEMDFQKMNEGEALKYSARIKQAAIDNRDSSDEIFADAIIDASCGAITFTRCANGRQVKFTECQLFRDSHRKKHPGRIAYDKIDTAVMDIYRYAHNKDVVNMPPKQHEEQDTAHSLMNIQKRTAKELIDLITTTVTVYLFSDEDTQKYLLLKNCTLEEDIANYTNAVISCSIDNNSVIFKTAAGREITINVTKGISRESLKRKMSGTIRKLLISSAISSMSHMKLSEVVEIDTIEELVYAEVLKDDEYTFNPECPSQEKAEVPTQPSVGYANIARIAINETLVSTNAASCSQRDEILNHISRIVLDKQRCRQKEFSCKDEREQIQLLKAS